ncbi:Phosphoribosylaminoimidazole-succinocarboxamide synthase [Rhodotorula diobovata]|uniref:Phosphoribosylaminoimidazole-succinocarboxamide synthase n=1 Tax=Rhodotorula diobovata TaxID=5288 RepID=A0A5C5FW01_9BASI|nr:Phosphoribosylaminoimidazole-succinocarboxamide synthase [Rhodotorula diobovata]
MSASDSTHCPSLKLLAKGKVRDIYAIPDVDDALLFVATDRVSAFDVVMKNGIPNKGKLLTQLSLFFFDLLSHAPETRHIPNHVITSNVADMPAAVHPYRDQLEGRAILVRKATVLPVEAIVRGYITGSAWAEYQKSGTMHDMKLPEGLKESSRFEPPLFTPSTKAEVGDKDINIHPDEVSKHLPDPALAKPLQEYALALYSTAAAHSLSRGLILADTKFEFGLLPPPSPGGAPVLALVDECLTPDSSRFWPRDQYAEGARMVGFDKQFLREWLKSGGGGFGSKGGGIGEDPVEIPREIVEQTWGKYEEAFELLTGRKFAA